MTFGNRLSDLRKEAGFSTRNEFADRLGIPSTTLRNYETDAREPGHTFIKRMAEFFDVSADYLLCLTDERQSLHAFRVTASEEALVRLYRGLNDAGRDKLLDYADDLDLSGKYGKDTQTD